MTKDSSHHQIEEIHSEAEAVVNACKTLLGNGELSHTIEKAGDRLKEDCQRLLEKRNLKNPVISFIGQRNTGKSTLVRSLLRSERIKEKIPCGFKAAEKTRQLYWIGAEEPEDGDETMETHLPATAEEMVDLGTPYTMIDTPGSSDAGNENVLTTERAIERADLFVLVVQSEQLEAERVFIDIHSASGGLILPVIRLSPQQTKEWLKSSPTLPHRDFVEAVEIWTRHLPHTQFLDPILIPDLDVTATIPEEKSISHLLSVGLRSALQEESLLRSATQQRLLVRLEEWRDEVGSLILPLFRHSEKSIRDLQEAQKGLNEEVIQWLFRDWDSLDIHLKWIARAYLLERVSPLFFPITGVWKALSLTSGAWDRAVWAASGSILSLLGTTRQGWRNMRERKQAKQSYRKSLFTGLSGHLLQRFQPIFHRALQDIQPFSTSQLTHSHPVNQLDIHGMDALAACWSEKEPAVVKKQQTSSVLLFLTAATSFLFFWWVVGGPLIHLYGQHLPAAYSSWIGNWDPASLQLYPSLPIGFWLTTVVLALFPSILLGMLLLHSVSSTSQIHRIRQQLKQEIQYTLLKGELSLTVESSSPELKAIHCLARYRQ